MMKIQDVIDDLSGGELRNHSWFQGNVLTDTNRKNIVNAIDVCLTDLYTRYPLLLKELTLIQHGGLTRYWLFPRFSKYSGSTEPIKYIEDTLEEPFTDTVLRVDQLFDEVGCEIVLNSNKKCKVAFTPAPELLEIPNPVDTNALFVIYRTRPNKLTDADIEFLLPEQFRPALLAYVAYRAYSGHSDPQANNLAMLNFQKYEMLCAQYIHNGMVNTDDNIENCKFDNEGWA